MKRFLFLCIAVAISLAITGLFGSVAQAQNTGGVFGPLVTDGHKSAEYRIAINTDTDRIAQRVHYQQSINDELMWRVVGQSRETATSNFDFDFVQAELFWHLTQDDSADYAQGLRFDARLRDDDRPGQVGVNWTHQWRLGDGWSARAVALTTLQFGDNNAKGIGLGTRGQLARRLESGATLGLELYSGYGRTNDFRDLDDQSHTLGPFFRFGLTESLDAVVGVQFGLTEPTPDADLRLWVVAKL